MKLSLVVPHAVVVCLLFATLYRWLRVFSFFLGGWGGFWFVCLFVCLFVVSSVIYLSYPLSSVISFHYHCTVSILPFLQSAASHCADWVR